MIWVSCDGENSADREHIGNVTYTPFRGFPTYYFPYKNIPGYLSPIVALQFQKPEGTINSTIICIFKITNLILKNAFFFNHSQTSAGVLINIECKVWAKNIIHDRQRRLGSVHFELLMD